MATAVQDRCDLVKTIPRLRVVMWSYYV
jgi:hypothetical protein